VLQVTAGELEESDEQEAATMTATHAGNWLNDLMGPSIGPKTWSDERENRPASQAGQ
jgi:hypothetical protein